MSKIISWDEKYISGIEEIDSQHKRIFESVNQLYEACERLESRENVLELIESLDFYTVEHFASEEEYMLEYNYSAYEAHKQAHEAFKKVYETIRNNYNYEKNQTIYIQALHLNQMLADWLDYHLQNEDSDFIAFLKNNITGLKSE